MPIRPIPIRASSNIQSVAYDSETQDMTIQFYGRNALSNAVYIYHQVPENIAIQFSEAFSPGKFFRENLLNQYPFEQVQ